MLLFDYSFLPISPAAEILPETLGLDSPNI